MKLKDALVGLLFWVWILAFGAHVLTANSIPLWILLILAVVVWIAYILVIIRDYQKSKKNVPLVWMKLGGKWRALGSDGLLIPEQKTPTPPTPRRTPPPPVNDQEEDKV